SDSGTTQASLAVNGAAILVLTNSGNTYNGSTQIDTGAQGPATLRAAANNALGAGQISIAPAGNASTGRLELIGGVTLPNPIYFAGRNNDSVSIENISGNNTLSGTATINVGGNRYWIQSDAGTLTLSGA